MLGWGKKPRAGVGEIRKEKVVLPTINTPAKLPRRPASSTSALASRSSSRAPRATSATRSPSASSPTRADPDRLQPKRKKLNPRPSPVLQSSDESDSDSSDRTPRTAQSRDPDRRVRHKNAFSENKSEFDLIQAADIASTAKGYKPALKAKESVEIELQYPSASRPEKYVSGG